MPAKKKEEEKESGEWSIGYNSKEGITVKMDNEALGGIFEGMTQTGGFLDKLLGGGIENVLGHDGEHEDDIPDGVFHRMRAEAREVLAAQDQMTRERIAAVRRRSVHQDIPGPPRKPQPVGEPHELDGPHEVIGDSPLEPSVIPVPKYPPGQPIPVEECQHDNVDRLKEWEDWIQMTLRMGYTNITEETHGDLAVWKGSGYYCPNCLSKVM